ncbi:hypothetical protein BD311DRAFT_747146 [Dichomitus squalens]|uniref:Uncharacterized protein n=1 Tax=Dichomitus squalens TaxID=114155 RepID=A0A4Q9N1T9_9APHY|nr:hypothetical protein BD311DRAFT_747146 [Dichomitus squalens]
MDTDAVTLTGGEDGDDHSWQEPGGYEVPTPLSYDAGVGGLGGQGEGEQSESGAGEVGSTGKMQKVGDKWMFVRGT